MTARRPAWPGVYGTLDSPAMSTVDLAALRAAVEARHPRYLTELEQLVNIDCGSYTPAGVNRVADFVAEALGELGATVERTPHAPGDRRGATRRPGRRAGSRAAGRGSC